MKIELEISDKEVGALEAVASDYEFEYGACSDTDIAEEVIDRIRTQMGNNA